MNSFGLLSTTLSIIFFNIFNVSNGIFSCKELNGIGDDPSDIFTVSELSNVPIGQIGLTQVQVNAITRPASPFETAVSFQKGIYNQIALFSTASSYDPVALEFFGRVFISARRRRCQPDPSDSSAVGLFQLHRTVSLAYTTLYIYQDRYTLGFDTYKNIFENVWGLNASLCDENQDEFPSTCLDISTPWGLAYKIAKELRWFSEYDGWNQFGKYNREYNRVPYSDPRNEDRLYTPVNDPYNLEIIDRWQPLEETDNEGFEFWQKHVVPHIGYTAKSFIFSNGEICDRSEQFASDYPPNYDYEAEIDLLLDRLANLNDVIKMQVETFDDKIASLLPPIGQYQQAVGTIPDSLDSIAQALIAFLTWYEGGIAVWKEKVDFDRVRTTSIIRKLRYGEQVTTYAGTTLDGATFGTQTFDGKDFQPYIRIMPHAEYPSGSSCVCEAYAQALKEYTGIDNFITAFGTPFFASATAKSSKVEPLTTPENDVFWTYSSWSEVSQICGETRLQGGMHFTASVPNGKELCRDIGTRTVETVNKLISGEKPYNLINFWLVRFIRDRTCYPDTYH